MGATGAFFIDFRPISGYYNVHWALSLVGRAPRLQRGGQRFESARVHLSKPTAWLACGFEARSYVFSVEKTSEGEALGQMRATASI